MLLDAISKAGTIALGGHVRPDGDCAGSCMGLYNYVRENFPEKEIDVYLEELPNTLKFMKNTDRSGCLPQSMIRPDDRTLRCVLL